MNQMLTAEDRSLIREFNANMKRYLKMQEEQKQQQTLLSVHELKKIAVWNGREELRRAREKGYVKVVRMNGSIRYVKDSIDPMFLKKATA